ncbi:hypothetical protein [Rhizobium paknamense]|uniref:Secreted protein n=1 Tax=Rhizobium paknamense TaxID=1206817 RepID=A0ABU0IE65_9HYPH|nr:hypothetical protein [Rhizobium paknamense]MDQ0456540.1 hypothetical protein [Rhizobium paknamense]
MSGKCLQVAVLTAVLLPCLFQPAGASTGAVTCGKRNFTALTPADRLDRLDQFRDTLSPQDRNRLDRAMPRSSQGGVASCDAVESSRASCEDAAYAKALRETHLMRPFLSSLCAP